MECNIYAHHQIKTVFLYFLLGEMELNSNLNVRFFFSTSFPQLKKQILVSFILEKEGCERALQDFSQIEKKPDLRKF